MVTFKFHAILSFKTNSADRLDQMTQNEIIDVKPYTPNVTAINSKNTSSLKLMTAFSRKKDEDIETNVYAYTTAL
jgi:hypothetical protein